MRGTLRVVNAFTGHELTNSQVAAAIRPGIRSPLLQLQILVEAESGPHLAEGIWEMRLVGDGQLFREGEPVSSFCGILDGCGCLPPFEVEVGAMRIGFEADRVVLPEVEEEAMPPPEPPAELPIVVSSPTPPTDDEDDLIVGVMVDPEWDRVDGTDEDGGQIGPVSFQTAGEAVVAPSPAPPEPEILEASSAEDPLPVSRQSRPQLIEGLRVAQVHGPPVLEGCLF